MESPISEEDFKEQPKWKQWIIMGRLVHPISEEDFKKLPKWQQWISIHWYVPLGTFVFMFVFLIVLKALGII